MLHALDDPPRPNKNKTDLFPPSLVPKMAPTDVSNRSSNEYLQTFAVLFFFSQITLFPTLFVGVSIYLIFFTSYWWLLIFYAVWLYLDKDTPYRGARPWMPLKRSALFRLLRDYFPVSLVKTAELDPSRNYLIGFHPHGPLAVGVGINFATDATEFSQKYPGIQSYVTSWGYRMYLDIAMPLFREILLKMGCIDAGRKSIKHVFSDPQKGRAVVIIVGGSPEIAYTKPGDYRLYLLKRKNFVKLAIETGADLVPCYSFGENDVFNQPQGNWYKRLQEKFAHRNRGNPHAIPLLIPMGRYGILPYKKPVTSVVGKPIRIEQCDEPSEQMIDCIHAEYVKQLTQLFEGHKRNYGIAEDVHLDVV